METHIGPKYFPKLAYQISGIFVGSSINMIMRIYKKS